MRIDVEDRAGPEVENQQVAEHRIEGKAERMRARSLDVDLPDDIAARADDDQHGVAGESAVGVEAERRDVDVAIGSDREAFGAALYVLRNVRQHSQHVDWTALPRTCGNCRENSHRSTERGNADLKFATVFYPPH